MSEATAALTGDNGAAGGEVNQAGQTVQPQAWNTGFDEDTSAYVEKKGWKGVSDVLTSYRNLEKFAGGSKSLLELPGEDAGEDVVNNFYNKLGRPETPDQYGLQAPEGADKGLMDWFRQTAHQHGLSDKQARGLFEAWNSMIGERMQSMQQEQAQQAEMDIGSLRKEWGKAFDEKIDAGKRAVSALGYDEQTLNNLESKLGTAEMLKLFATIGSKMGEDAFVGTGRESSGFGLTPAAARQEISDLRMNKDFMTQYLNGNQDAVAKMKRLMEAAHG
jgi:hypothetical protein